MPSDPNDPFTPQEVAAIQAIVRAMLSEATERTGDQRNESSAAKAALIQAEQAARGRIVSGRIFQSVPDVDDEQAQARAQAFAQAVAPYLWAELDQAIQHARIDPGA